MYINMNIIHDLYIDSFLNCLYSSCHCGWDSMRVNNIGFECDIICCYTKQKQVSIQLDLNVLDLVKN